MPDPPASARKNFVSSLSFPQEDSGPGFESGKAVTDFIRDTETQPLFNQTAFGNVKADVLVSKDPHFKRGGFCSAIRCSRWHD